jgi:hypothetical protein
LQSELLFALSQLHAILILHYACILYTSIKV